MNIKNIVFVLVVMCCHLFGHAQQDQWILPTTGPNTATVSFKGGAPVFGNVMIPNAMSTQTVGNGEYCDECSPDGLGEFYITGHIANQYNLVVQQPFDPVRELMVSYSDFSFCNAQQHTYLMAPGVDLTYEGLSEVAVGNGPANGQFFAVMLSDANTNPVIGGLDRMTAIPSGRDVSVVLMDFVNNPPSNPPHESVNNILTGQGFNPNQYWEGVALGPVFTYDGNAPGAMLAWNNAQLRSVYVAAARNGTGGHLYHLLLDVASGQLINYAMAFAGTTFQRSVMEIELSFPQAQDLHPSWLATTGEVGTTVIQLDANGGFVQGVDLHTGQSRYGVEFDPRDQNLYFTMAGAASTQSTLNRYDLTTFPATANTLMTTVNATPCNSTIHVLTLESAANGNIYMLDNQGLWWEISNTSAVNPTLSAPIDLYAQNMVLAPCGLGIGLPDWVDGETPNLGGTGQRAEVCYPQGCGGEDVVVTIERNGQPFTAMTLSPGECKPLWICASDDYHFFIDGQFFQQIFVQHGQVINLPAGIGAFGIPPYPNTTIAADEVWEGKVFVNQDITVRNGATLDITECDVIFAPCVGISFEDGSSLRATNSTFRTCLEDEYWLGFSFSNDCFAYLQDNNFKRAVVAVDISRGIGDRNSEAFISANTFVDNWVAVRFAATTIGMSESFESISNNIIEVRTAEFTESECIPEGPFQMDFRGLVFDNVRMNGLITGNSFSDLNLVAGSANVYAIHAHGSEVHINSENTFTDVHRALDLHNCSNSSFDRNRVISTTQDQTTNVSIRSTNNINCRITGNDMSSVRGIVNTAIYEEACLKSLIEENTIYGYARGIVSHVGNDITIRQNYIDQVSQYGIATYHIGGLENPVGNNIDIVCNEVHMDSDDGQAGIKVYQDALGEILNINVMSNCVFDAKRSIYVERANLHAGYGTPNFKDIPNIRNNYLYNFQVGLSAYQYDGYVGYGSSSPEAAGKNSFHANNHHAQGGALDIYADNPQSNPLVAHGNYGVAFYPTGPSPRGYVTVFSDMVYWSSAACGGQSGTNAQDVNNYLDVDRWCNEPWELMNYQDGQNPPVLPVFKTGVGELLGAQRLLSAVLNYGTSSQLVQAASDLLKRDLSSKELQLAKWMIDIYSGIEVNLMETLDQGGFQADDILVDMAFCLALKELRSKPSWTGLTSKFQLRLQEIEGKNSPVSPIARELLQLHTGGVDFKFKTHTPLQQIPNLTFTSNQVLDQMSVYPNPSGDELIKLQVEAVEFKYPEVRLTNITGQLIIVEASILGNGLVEFDASSLAAGPYAIALFDGDEFVASCKFVKN